MENRGFIDRISRAVDLTTEPIPGKPLIEIMAGRSVLIENHCGVIAYDPQHISVKTKQGCICVRGEGLMLSKMSKDRLRICGMIFGVDLRGRG